MTPCPRCGAEVEPHSEDLGEEAIAAGVTPDEWVECSQCDYGCTLEFHEDT